MPNNDIQHSLLPKPHAYLIRDRDRVYGAAVTRRLRASGIRDKPIAPGSPWQNGFAERLIGSIRPRVRSSSDCPGRSALTPNPYEVCCLLQRVEDSSVSWQRRYNPSCHPAKQRPHRIGAGRGWPSPLLLSNLVFGTDSPSLVCCQRAICSPPQCQQKRHCGDGRGLRPNRTDLGRKVPLDPTSPADRMPGDPDANSFFRWQLQNTVSACVFLGQGKGRGI